MAKGMQGTMSTRPRAVRSIARLVTACALVLPIGLVTLVGTATAAGAAKSTTTTTTTTPPSSSSSGSSSSSNAKSLATLKITAPDVTVQAKGESSFKAATDGQSLQAGDVVKTGPTGRAEVQYAADTFTRLDVNTTFKVVRLTDDQGNRRVQGSLDTGRTWNRTATLTQSESFEQQGAGASAAVLGTAFAIDCDTATHCTFYAVDHPIQMTDDGGQQILNPLQVIDITDGDPSAITTLTIDQIAAIAWIQQNLFLDKLEGIGDGPFVPVTGVLVVQNGQVESFTPGDIPPPPPPPPTAPGAPTNVSVEPAGPGTATVSFDPPADGGSPITGYTVVATAGGQDPVTATGPGSPITVTGLTNGVTYDFTVTATNGVGTGSGSTPFALPIPPTAPGAPTILSATATGPNSVDVAFDPPADDGGSPITSYIVTATADGQDPGVGTGPGSPITVGNLIDGVTYSFAVTATNSAGTGGPSSAAEATTPETPKFAADMIRNAADNLAYDQIDDSLDCFSFRLFGRTITLCNVITGGGYTFTFNYVNPDVVDAVSFSALPDSSVGNLYSIDEGDPDVVGDELDGAPPACRLSSDCTPVTTDTDYQPSQPFQFTPSLGCAVLVNGSGANDCKLPSDTTFTAEAHSDDPLVPEPDSVDVPVTIRDSDVPVDGGGGGGEGSDDIS
jgi:hypothetical protein